MRKNYNWISSDAIDFINSNDVPIYEGIFEVYDHKNCPLIKIADALSLELLIDVLKQRTEQSLIRFGIDGPLPNVLANRILKPLIKKKLINKVIIWAGNNTVFEIEMNEGILGLTADLVNKPISYFGDFYVSPEKEKFRLLLPGEIGRKNILNLQIQFDNLNWNAKLIEFRKRDVLNFQRKAIDLLGRISFLITPDEVSIAEKAVELGYFERPRGITLEKLADELDMSSSTINRKLREINKKLVRLTLDKIGDTSK